MTHILIIIFQSQKWNYKADNTHILEKTHWNML